MNKDIFEELNQKIEQIKIFLEKWCKPTDENALAEFYRDLNMLGDKEI